MVHTIMVGCRAHDLQDQPNLTLLGFPSTPTSASSSFHTSSSLKRRVLGSYTKHIYILSLHTTNTILISSLHRLMIKPKLLGSIISSALSNLSRSICWEYRQKLDRRKYPNQAQTMRKAYSPASTCPLLAKALQLLQATSMGCSALLLGVSVLVVERVGRHRLKT